MADGGVRVGWFVVAALTLLPGILAWLGGRRLVAAADDPCLPERLWALRRRLSSVTAIILAFLLLGAGAGLTAWTTFWWAVPLLILGRALGGFPGRRRLLGETWSLLAYLRFFAGWFAASLGFWLLLAVVPALLNGVPAFALSSSLCALLLLAWNHWSAAIARTCLGAAPLTDPSWRTAFEPILRASRIGTPGIWRFGPAGSAFANALALPSVTGHGVLLSNALLERLTREETCAVFAHEVAHLEQFAPGLRRWYAILAVTVVAGAVGVPLIGRLRPDLAGSLAAVWPFVVLATLLARVNGRQRQETESDRRAVELSGDAEALVAGLTRIYAIGLLPRQWETRIEQSASHPSLARRIQAIRGLAGIPAAPRPPASSRPFFAPAGTEAVLLEPDGLRYFVGLTPGTAGEQGDLLSVAATAHRFRYADLIELRVIASGTAGPSVRWVERGGKRWTMTIAVEDIPEFRNALEPGEALLAPVPRRAGANRPLVRLLAGVALLLATIPSWHALVVPAIIALLRPGGATFAAAAVTLLGTAAVALSRGAGYLDSLWWLPLVLGSACGLVALRLLRDRGSTSERTPAWVPATMAVSVLAVWILWVLDARGSLVRSVLAASESTALVVLPLAFAALVVFQAGGSVAQQRWRTIAAVLLLGGALLPVVATTSWFVGRFVRDPLLPAAQALTLEQARLTVANERVLDGFGAELRVAPGGTWVALKSYPAQVRSSRATAAFKMADAAGHQVTVDAEELEFLSADTAIVLAWRGEQHEVQLRRLDQPEVPTSWARALPGVMQPRLDVDAVSGRWQATGWGSRGGIVRVEGAIGRDGVTERRWEIPEALDEGAPELLVGGERRAWVGHEYNSFWLSAAPSLLVRPSAYWPDTIVVREGNGGTREMFRSTADVRCLPAMAGGTSGICAAFDGQSTTVTAIDPDSREAKAIGKVDGRALLLRQGASGLILMRGIGRDGRLVVLDRERGRVLELRDGLGGGYFDAALAPGFVAVAQLTGRNRTGNRTTRVRVFRYE